jgi:hypothetical protein
MPADDYTIYQPEGSSGSSNSTAEASSAEAGTSAAANGTPTDSGMGGTDWNGIGDMIDGAIGSVSGLAFDAQSTAAENPCEAVFVVNEWIRSINVTQTNVGRIASKVSTAGRESVTSALAHNGEPGTGYAGSTWLGAYYIEQGVFPVDPLGIIEAFMWAGLWPIAVALGIAFDNGVSNMLTQPGEKPSRARKGFEIQADVFLYAGPGKTDIQHIESGRLIGPRVRDVFDAWIDMQRRDVYPTAFASWRIRLGEIVGGDPARWYIWRPGQEITPLSWLGTLVEREDEREEMRERYIEECQRRQLVGETFVIDQAEKEHQQQLFFYIAAAAVLVVWGSK